MKTNKYQWMKDLHLMTFVCLDILCLLIFVFLCNIPISILSVCHNHTWYLSFFLQRQKFWLNFSLHKVRSRFDQTCLERGIVLGKEIWSPVQKGTLLDYGCEDCPIGHQVVLVAERTVQWQWEIFPELKDFWNQDQIKMWISLGIATLVWEGTWTQAWALLWQTEAVWGRAGGSRCSLWWGGSRGGNSPWSLPLALLQCHCALVDGSATWHLTVIGDFQLLLGVWWMLCYWWQISVGLTKANFDQLKLGVGLGLELFQLVQLLGNF